MARQIARLVIIGNGMAGVSVAEECLRLKPELPITIFGDEPHVNYNRILLSDVLAGKRSMESIYLNPLAWYQEHKIDLRMGCRVTGIDVAAQTVTDAGGAVTPYGHLVIAVGAPAFVPPVPGRDRAGVHVFRSIADSEAIIAQAKPGRRAVVIGGGLLGLEAARGLINYGVTVTVVHLMDRLMEQQLDAIGGAMLKREIECLGLEVRLNATTTDILGDGGNGHASGVRLADGQVLPADLVVICAGVRPDLALAKAAGLATNRGILVDDQLRTSDPRIFAVGDVIEHRGRVYGLVAPLRDQARVVADTLLGAGTKRYEGTVCATTLKVAGVHVTSAGKFLTTPGDEDLAFMDTQAGVYKKLVVRGPKLLGMILLGDNKDGPRLSKLIETGDDITMVKAQLLGVAGVAGAGTPAGLASPAVTMADSDLVCNCNTVTKGAIVTAIKGKGCKTRDEVAACTAASTGCGSCAQLVDDLIQMVNHAPVSSQPAPMKGELELATFEATSASGLAMGMYPTAYPTKLEVDRIKREGLGLDWGRIQERGAPALSADDYYRLKTYGVCSQKHPGYFMVRIRIPGGRLTAMQLTRLADLADTHGRGWGHLTTRQDLELHWVRVEEVPEMWAKLEEVGITTRSACGHTMRNVTACSHAGLGEDSLLDTRPWADAISQAFIKQSDLLNPLMPSRLNIYFAGCRSCASEARINDIGFAAIRAGGDPADAPPEPTRAGGAQGAIGFELWAGGSLGAHPMLGYKLREWIPLEDALPACQAIFHLHTKYGNRNKAKSRLKFLIDQWGIEKFTSMFNRVFEEKRNLPENREVPLPTSGPARDGPSVLNRMGTMLTAPFAPLLWPSRPFGSAQGRSMAGVTPQQQTGYSRVSVAVPLGEIRAEQLRTISRLSRRYGNGQVQLTAQQDVELHWVKAGRVKPLARALERAGLWVKGTKGGLTHIGACPGTEFCVLAVTNSQGAVRDIGRSPLLTEWATESKQSAWLRDIALQISGCPNSCAKQQVVDIGLVGSMTVVNEERRYSYLMTVGGHLGETSGDVRLGEAVRKGITEDRVTPTVEALVDLAWQHRQDGESFQSVVARLGSGRLADLLTERLGPVKPEEAAGTAQHEMRKVELALSLREGRGA